MTTDSEQKKSVRQRRRTAAEDRERARQAFSLKVGGATFDSIARALDYYDAAAAYRAYQSHQAKTQVDPETVEHHRTLELARLEDLWAAWYVRGVGDPGNPQAGRPPIPPDPEAAQKLIQIHDRKVKLLGLHREPTYDPEEDLRRYAKERGLDPDEVMRQAEGIIAGFRGHA